MKTHRTQIPTLLSLGLALTLAASARAGLTPITFAPGSFNADVVVETNVPSFGNSSTATVDGGTNDNGDTWFEIGYSTGGPGGANAGVPHAGSLLTNVTDIAGSVANPHIYQLAPSWAAPNAILIDSGPTRTNAVITVSPGGPYTKLSFMVSSGNGGGNVNVKITHADSTVETNVVVCGDWFNGPSPAFISTGRIQNTQSGGFDTQGSITSGPNPRWYSRDITLTDTTSAITSIQLSYGTGGGNVHNQVFGVAGSSGGAWTPLTISGYTDDMVWESNSPIAGPLISPVTGTNATTQSMDSDVNTGNSWYEQGFYRAPGQAVTGIPRHGSTLTNTAGDHIFQLAGDYTVNNAFYLNISNLTATATLAVPTNFVLISFLNASGSGPVPIGLLITHADSSTETNSFSSLDWFNGAGKIWSTGGRVVVNTGQLQNQNYPFAPNSAPYLYANDILLANTSSPVTSITMYFTPTNAAGRTTILAISGTQGAAAPLVTLDPVGTNMWPVVTGSNGPVILTSAANGLQPITYQWQIQSGATWVNVNNGAVGDGSSYSGATTATLTLSSASTPGTFNYQVVAHNVGGSTTSTPPATVVILSPLLDIPQAGDPGTMVNGSEPANESYVHAYDHLIGSDPGKYLNFGFNGGQPFLGPVGFTVTPSAGYSIVSGARIYTANDTPGRDPADIEIYGSRNGGGTYTLISSNSLALSDNRNATASEDIGANIETAVLQQIFFPNTNGYFSYKVMVTNVKNNGGNNSMQVGEVELLGIVTNAPAPTVQSPPNVVAYLGTNGVTFAALVTANGYTINSTVWQVQTNGNYVNLSDNATVSGSQTATLTLNDVPFGENLSGPSLPATVNLQLVVNSSGGSITSTPVTLTVISATPNILNSADAISDFGNSPVGTGNNAATLPIDAVDGTEVTYINTGVGPSAAAGFAPFEGPCGLIDTPYAGPTIITGIRFFCGSEGIVDDPINYTLEGSVNAGTNGPFVLIGASLNSLSLPSGRNNNDTTPIDPTVNFMQEIDFNNTQAYATYRVTFHDIQSDSTGVNVDIAELQLLGNFAPAKLTFSVSGGNLIINSSASGTLQNATNLLSPVWVDIQSIGPNSPATIAIQPGVPQSYYRVQAVQ